MVGASGGDAGGMAGADDIHRSTPTARWRPLRRRRTPPRPQTILRASPPPRKVQPRLATPPSHREAHGLASPNEGDAGHPALGESVAVRRGRGDPSSARRRCGGVAANKRYTG